MAWASLSAHKLRTGLTLLGVIIAVSTLILVVSVVEGMNAYVSERVASLGSSVFTIQRFPIITNFDDWIRALRRNKILELVDYEAVRKTSRLASAVGAQTGTLSDIKYKSQTLYDVEVAGVTASMVNIDPIQIDYGRYLAPIDVDHSKYVCFIGSDIVENLFPNVNPLGKIVRIRGISFEVVGVAKKVGTVFGQTQDNFVKIPLSTHQKMFGSRRSIAILVKATTPALLNDTIDEARVIMRARHHLKYKDIDDFGVVTASTINDLWRDLTGGIALTAVAVTSVFLVVGGVVIMNIMIAVVSERTREIGIRKSLGARRRDILIQFLIESVVMSALGGAIGILLAYIGTKIMSAATPVPSSLPLWAVAVALLVSSLVGLFFGIYPANKAAKLDPIVALRYE